MISPYRDSNTEMMSMGCHTHERAEACYNSNDDAYPVTVEGKTSALLFEVTGVKRLHHGCGNIVKEWVDLWAQWFVLKLHCFRPCNRMIKLGEGKRPWLQGSWGQHGAHLGPTGPRWAPCWPHELCYLGYKPTSIMKNITECDVYALIVPWIVPYH